jgi:hypothetical protein
MAGVVLKDCDLVKALLENTHTESGLSVKANVLYKVYEKGKKARADLYDRGTIIFDKILRKLNYKVVPAYQ